MIYAIQAVGTQYIKFGKANSVGRRLAAMETGCPFELELKAAVDWDDRLERVIHKYLAQSAHRLEWFVESDDTASVILWMQLSDGLERFHLAVERRLGTHLFPKIKQQKEAQKEETPPVPLRLSHARRREERKLWWAAQSQRSNPEEDRRAS